MIISNFHNWACETSIKKWVSPKDSLIHLCINIITYHYTNTLMHQYNDNILIYYIWNIDILFQYFWYMTFQSDDVNNCIKKYQKSMIYKINLKVLLVWRIYYITKYAIIHCDIELINFKSCTLMYCLDHWKIN